MNLKLLCAVFLVIAFSNILKGTNTNAKIPGAVFFADPFFKYLKKDTYEY